MGLTLIAPPAVEPVSLDDLKRHLRIDGTTEDLTLTTLGVVARAAVERLAAKAMITQTWRWSFDRMPPDGILSLPIAPVQTVTGMRVADGAGGHVAVPGDRLVLDVTDEPARLLVKGPVPAPGVAIAGIEVDIVAGYGATVEQVPPLLAAAVRLLTAHWYATRGEPASAAMPPDVADLLAGYRRRRMA